MAILNTVAAIVLALAGLYLGGALIVLVWLRLGFKAGKEIVSVLSQDYKIPNPRPKEMCKACFGWPVWLIELNGALKIALPLVKDKMAEVLKESKEETPEETTTE